MNRYFEAMMEKNLKDLSTRIQYIQDEINDMQDCLNKLKLHLIAVMNSDQAITNKKENKNESDKH